MAENDASTGVRVTGRVIWDGAEGTTGYPIVKAVRVATETDAPSEDPTASAAGSVATAICDESGEFLFEDLNSGSWKFYALHDRVRSSEPAETVQVVEGMKPLRLQLRLQSQSDKWWGIGTLAALILILVVSLISYVDLHFRHPNAPARAFSGAGLERIGELRTDVTDQATLGEVEKLAEKTAALRTTIQDAIQHADPPLDEALQSKILTVAGRLAEVEASSDETLDQARRESLLAHLDSLEALLPESRQGGFFWADEPWLYVEVAFWGWLGILANLIVTCGGYLRHQTFLREGIYLHLALLVVVPFVALIFVLALSTLSLTINTEAGSPITVDFSEPLLLVVIAFLVGQRPWLIWARLRKIGGRIAGETGGQDVQVSQD